MPEITAPMVGKLLKFEVGVGDTVQVDDVVAILEAMKMHVEIYADDSGVVKALKAAEGDVVKAGDVLMVLE
ncbi:MAG: biotin/lipoyl-binding protein [Syntrophomonadaceae bacterium]|jgi:biotin carboxyl carrier protein|nr:biotin/lipoyl-binding protein [Syntrophomonadaceae bacterium]